MTIAVVRCCFVLIRRPDSQPRCVINARNAAASGAGRVGRLSSCHQALKEREKINNEPEFPALTPIMITVSIALLILMLVLLGGLVTVRFLIPLAIAVFVGWKIYELVKDKIRQ
ncbi:MAG TPA: hypothetical protein EYP41_01275 [Anaerolineae bacterium]|nr:hypothetical protein [Anaerolineae bacterium]